MDRQVLKNERASRLVCEHSQRPSRKYHEIQYILLGAARTGDVEPQSIMIVPVPGGSQMPSFVSPFQTVVVWPCLAPRVPCHSHATRRVRP